MKPSRLALLALLLLIWGYMGVRYLSSGDQATIAKTKQAKKKRKKKRSFPVVDLSLLEKNDHPRETPSRNPFDYHVKRVAPPPKAPPKPPPTRQAPPPPPPPPKQAALPPPPPPPITFKFEGVVTRGDEKYAILRDEEGILHVGKEGDTVAFRFKVLKIGHESIDMGYVDNAARQQIELSGS